MNPVRLFVAVALLALWGMSLAHAQRPEAQKGRVRQQVSTALLTSEAVEKLKLTAEQKEKYAKIEEDYKDNQKTAEEKFRAAVKGQDRNKTREAFQNQRADAEKRRTESLSKVEALLTAEQKKTFEEVKKEPSPAQPGARPGVNPPGRARPGSVTTPAVGGQLLPPAAQEKLQLTEEQKKKIEAFQKEVEAKVLGVLTEEQKKQYEEMKKQSASPPQRRRPQP